MDAKITELTELTTPALGDVIAIVDDPGGSPVTKKMALSSLVIDDDTMATASATNVPTSESTKAYVDLRNNAPEGFLINGKIVPSVASNNLTVAIKGLDGNDPSATNPVYIMLGGVLRSITSALSVTKNAGTNWCNAGGAELAAKEVDYFVYLGYNATDGVTLGFSRIPYANLYSDFSATSTNEKYCAISTITNAAAGNNYVNIGRFAATLSAGAGYTWTVPTFTAANLIQRPIYDSRWLNFVPVWTTPGTTPSLGAGSVTAKYKVVSDMAKFSINYIFGADTTFGNNLWRFTMPFTPARASQGVGRGDDVGTAPYVFILDINAGNIIYPFTTLTNNAYVTNTVPFTWGNGDIFSMSGEESLR